MWQPLSSESVADSLAPTLDSFRSEETLDHPGLQLLDCHLFIMLSILGSIVRIIVISIIITSSDIQRLRVSLKLCVNERLTHPP